MLVKIESFVTENTTFLEGRQILNAESFFKEPLDSADLGIFKTTLDLGEKLRFQLEDIQHKIICLPFENQYILLPILHSCLPQ